MSNSEILNLLQAKKGNLKQIEFAKKIVNTTDEILAVKTADVKNLAKQIAKTNAKEYLNGADLNIYEQKLLYGFVLGYANLSVEEFKAYLFKFFAVINCWALCDSPISTMKIIEKNKDYFFNFFVENLKNKNPFVVRFSIVAFFKFYLGNEYIDRVVEIYKKIKSNEYYINIGLAWGVCEILTKQYNKGVEILKQKALDKWVQNKAIQKARESFRISTDKKEFLLTLKM